jgi:hypothetical protein
MKRIAMQAVRGVVLTIVAFAASAFGVLVALENYRDTMRVNAAPKFITVDEPIPCQKC